MRHSVPAGTVALCVWAAVSRHEAACMCICCCRQCVRLGLGVFSVYVAVVLGVAWLMQLVGAKQCGCYKKERRNDYCAKTGPAKQAIDNAAACLQDKRQKKKTVTNPHLRLSPQWTYPPTNTQVKLGQRSSSCGARRPTAVHIPFASTSTGRVPPCAAAFSCCHTQLMLALCCTHTLLTDGCGCAAKPHSAAAVQHLMHGATAYHLPVAAS